MKQRHRKHRSPVRDLLQQSRIDQTLRAIWGRVGTTDWIRPLASRLGVDLPIVFNLYLTTRRCGLVDGSLSFPYLTRSGHDRMRSVDRSAEPA